MWLKEGAFVFNLLLVYDGGEWDSCLPGKEVKKVSPIGYGCIPWFLFRPSVLSVQSVILSSSKESPPSFR